MDFNFKSGFYSLELISLDFFEWHILFQHTNIYMLDN